MRINKSIHTNGRKMPLMVMPASSDTRFKETQLVFGKSDKATSADYFDRLRQYDISRYEAAKKAADQAGLRKFSANWFERLLQEYYNCSVELKFVTVRLMPNGYPEIVLGHDMAQPVDEF